MGKHWMAPLCLSVMISLSSFIVAGFVDTPRKPEAKPAPKTVSSQAAAGKPEETEMRINGNAELKLIDISHYDTVSNWNALKQSVDGVYIKATEGTAYVDPSFCSNALSAAAANIPAGFYHYFWPVPGDGGASARAQATHFYQTTATFSYGLTPVVDVEEANGCTPTEISSQLQAYAIQILKLTGKKVMIYCSPNFAKKYLTDPSLATYPVWIANYNAAAPLNTGTWHTYDVWQYGETVSVAGVTGPVDGDIASARILLDNSGGTGAVRPLSSASGPRSGTPAP